MPESSKLKYKALLIDLDDTLTKSELVYGDATTFVATYLARRYNIDLKDFIKLVNEKHLVVHRNFPTVHTRHSRILVFRMALDEAVDKYDLGLLPDIEEMYWEYFLNHVELFDGVKETLNILKNAGVKIAIVSDGGLALRIKKVRKVGILHLVDEVIASEEVIFEKPFSAIFTLALSRLDVNPDEAIMVGNNYKNDIRGAQLVGIRSGIIHNSEYDNLLGQDGTIVPDFTINELYELLLEFGLRHGNAPKSDVD